MLKYSLLITAIVLANFGLSAYPSDTLTHSEKTSGFVKDSTFQEVINRSILQSFITKSITPIEKELNHIKDNSNIPENWKLYWSAYLYYQQAILYKTQLGDDKNASKATDISIDLLKDHLNTSEEYALYAACLSFSIQFTNMMQMPGISKEVNRCAEKALELNKQNLRGYYVLASQDFYTPKMFGGMKRTEEYAAKGLASPTMLDSDDFYAPAWGKMRLYKILMEYYEQQKDTEQLEALKAKVKEDFPDNL